MWVLSIPRNMCSLFYVNFYIEPGVNFNIFIFVMLYLFGSEWDMLKSLIQIVDVSIFYCIFLSCCSVFFESIFSGAYVCDLIFFYMIFFFPSYIGAFHLLCFDFYFVQYHIATAAYIWFVFWFVNVKVINILTLLYGF